MRDPELVHRAERAALALERAWGRWRTMHGLGSDPLPPVSSYVGYSLEEPWGQPRVVFGVGAEEAERLAALLDGHDCVGPVHAGVTGRPDWLRGPGGGPETPGWPLADQLSIPRQAPGPGSDMFASASQDPAAGMDAAPADSAESAVDTSAEAGTGVTAAPEIIEPGDIAGPPVAAATINDVAATGVTADARTATDSLATDSLATDSAPTDSAVPPGRGGAGSRSQDADQSADTQQPREQAGTAGATDTVGPDQVPELAQPGIVAFRRRPGQPQEAEQLEAAPLTSDYDLMPNQGPGYRGPRYQGHPPQYQDAPDPDQAPTAYAAAPVAESHVSAPVSQPQRGKARQVSRLGRSRRQGPGAHESWGSAGEQPADHAM